MAKRPQKSTNMEDDITKAAKDWHTNTELEETLEEWQGYAMELEHELMKHKFLAYGVSILFIICMAIFIVSR